jgi:hypothetical protein
MTNRFPCDDKQRLIGYLYGELTDGDRATFDAHLATCAACAAEVADLRAVRVDLTAWQPPDAELGFRIVREAEAAPARRWWQVPGWAPVALAAGLLLALAASVEVEYGNGAVVIRTGWAKAAPVAATADARATAPRPSPVTAGLQTRGAMSEADVRAALASLESRLRTEMATVRTAAPVPSPGGADVDRAGVIRHVEDLIEASERRQQRELALRLAQAMQDVDTQRRSDLVRIENGLGQIEGLTVQEGARQNRLINYLMRTSQQER